MISVVMPTFNREKTIKRAIDSVINQTYSDLELIVVDDCSIDNTQRIINEYNDKRIKYYKLEKNMGACYARNYGIKKAKGEYIAFQDSDDEWNAEKLSKQLLNMKNSNSDIDFCSYYRYYNNNMEKMPKLKIVKRIKRLGIERALGYGNFISTQLILLKKECLKNIKFDDKLPRLQDYDLILRLSNKYKISHTNLFLVNVYEQNDSISKSQDKLIKAVEIMNEKEYKYKKNVISNLYSLIATISNDKKEKKFFYKKSMHYSFLLKNFIKYIIKY